MAMAVGMARTGTSTSRFRFLPDVDERGTAWIMKQREQHHVQCGQPGPALVQEDLLEGKHIGNLGQGPRSQISHQQDQHDFIGGKADDKGHQNEAIESERARKRIEIQRNESECWHRQYRCWQAPR